MGMARLTMVVLSSGMTVPGMLALAFKCLRFSGLALFRLLPRGGVLRIVDCVAFCCVIQVISLSVPPLLLMLKDTENGDFRHVPQTISLRDVAIGVKWGRSTEVAQFELRRLLVSCT
jgi:hypothetical protein